MSNKKEYLFKYEIICAGELVQTLIGEINRITGFLDDQVSVPLSSYDYFACIRNIMPLIEIASKIECIKPEDLFLKLNIPCPKISWPMFRNGLAHSIRPFCAFVGNQKINWRIAMSRGHSSGYNQVTIGSLQILEDLKNYLSNFKENANFIKIQIGIEFL